MKAIYSNSQNLPVGNEESTINLELRNDGYVLDAPQSGKGEVVCIRNAYKYYGNKKNPLVVLNGLSMTVSKGTIYTLLGASGCGKTTLLSCILGQRQLNSGEIWVFGKAPSTRDNGPRIGYMPQETALYGDFTVRETFTYFGWIAGMSNDHIKERFRLLSKLLLLPKGSQSIRTLSGGEQRRVSLAAALVHEPELLILDEPTVGTDPLLRETIWNYLKQITMEEHATVILTTHYIEEARQAHVVALIRGGQLLAEESPETLIAQHGVPSLQEIFLKLSVDQNSNLSQISRCREQVNFVSVAFNRNDDKIAFEETLGNKFSKSNTDANKKSSVKMTDYLPALKKSHMRALIWKNVLWWMRNIPILIFMTALPGVVLASFCLAVGGEPKNVALAIVNHETNNTDRCNNTLECNSRYLSCYLLQNIKKHSIVMVNYDSEEDAQSSALEGRIAAALIVRHNYSEALRARLRDAQHVKAWDIEYSTIDVVRDVSNQHVSNLLKKHLHEAFQHFVENYSAACGINERSFKAPINWALPIYGVKDPNFVDFALPGMLLTTNFILAVILSSSAMLVEKTECSFERTFAVGINQTELLVAHVACEFLIIVMQVAAAVIGAFAFFDMTQRGSLVLVVIFTLSAGFNGMCYGIFLSCFCKSELTVNIAGGASFFPTMMFSGIIWPIEGAQYLLRWFVQWLPLTKLIEGLRNVLQKDWDITADTVFNGFICVTVWTLMFLLISLISLKLQQR